MKVHTLQTIRDLISKVTYKGWEFNVWEVSYLIYLQIRFDAPCAVTGKTEKQYCRKWFLSKYMTDTEIIRTCFLAVEVAERHEMMERFRFDGKLISNPHMNIVDLPDEVVNNLDVREPIRL